MSIHLSRVEPLEDRIAPALAGPVAILINPSKLIYTDADGDHVTVMLSKPLLTSTTVANTVFDFTLGFVADPSAAPPIQNGQLQTIDLTSLASDGVNITMTVQKIPGGDGLANVGYINSTGHDLGKVTIPGDLGRIDAGNNDATTALASLSVKSMGLFGKATQNAGGSLNSNIKGPLGTLAVATDVGRVQIVVDAANDAFGTIGSATIGGFLEGSILTGGNVGMVKVGGDLAGGSIFSSGKLTAVKIGGSVFGGTNGNGTIAAGEIGTVTIARDLMANDLDETGKIDSFGKIASVTIGGSIIGGSGDENTVTLAGITHAGQIFAVGDIGLIKVGRDVRGGSGDASAKIVTRGKLGALTIGGSLLGGSGDYESSDVDDGQIFSASDMGPVKIGRDLAGGSGPASGLLLSNGKLAGATIGGSLVGEDGKNSGGIQATGQTGMIKIGHDVLGGEGILSGSIFSTGTIASVTVGGSLIGGPVDNTGFIASDMDIIAVKILHNVKGGGGTNSGTISAAKSVTIGGSLVGGVGMFSGKIQGFSIDTLTIGHNLLGGAGEQSGSIVSHFLGTVSIGGSVVGGSNTRTGWIESENDIQTIAIGGNLVGGSVSGAASLDSSGLIEAASHIGSLTIRGSVIAGVDNSTGSLTNSAQVRARNDIGSLTVGGSLIGHGDTGSGASLVTLSARGQGTPGTTDLAIGRISIGGRAEFANIFAGYDLETTTAPFKLKPVNADAQIGPVTVGGDWIASNVVAGAMNDAGSVATTDDNLNFGDLNDHLIAGGTAIVSQIASITIAGQVFGTPASLASTDHFGFVAEQIGALKIGTHAFTLVNGPANDGRIVAPTQDVTLHEVSALIGSTSPLPSSATLVNATTVTYTDVDGDHVTVKLSKPLLTIGNVNAVFKFDTGMVNDGAPAHQQLQLIDLGALATNGIGVTVTATPGGGDGLANIGAVTFVNFNAGPISIPGDVGQIAGGANNAGTPGLASLSVRSMGRLGLDSQPAAFGTFSPKLGGEVNGGIGALTVKQDIIGANIDVSGAIGPVNVGGSLIGAADTNSGLIASSVGIGTVHFGGNIEGGPGPGSGQVFSGRSIGAVTVGGSIVGSAGGYSGSISAVGAPGATGSLGAVSIAGDVLGGPIDLSGQIISGDQTLMSPSIGKITSVVLGGSLLGGVGGGSGRIRATGDMGTVLVGDDVQGGFNADSGSIISDTKLAGATIGGSVFGGHGDDTGTIQSGGDLGPVKIAHDLTGGDGNNVRSGIVLGVKKLASATIGGSLLGGSNGSSATLVSFGDLGAVKVGGNIRGGDGSFTGAISAGNALAMPVVPGKIASVTIGGSLLGGEDNDSGEIHGTDVMGAIKIGGNVMGGSGSSSGFIMSDASLTSVKVGGSLLGGSANFTGQIFGVHGIGALTLGGDFAGGTANFSGRITSEGKVGSIAILGSMIGSSNNSSTPLNSVGLIETSNDIGALSIGGNLIGGSVSGTGGVFASGSVTSNSRIVKVTIGGSIVSGVDRSASVDLIANATIRVSNDLATLTVKGSLLGNATADGISPVIISGNGEENPDAVNSAIGKLTVSGSVERATIFGDYTTSLNPDVKNAEITMIKVGRNWIASNVVVGMVNLGTDDAPGGTGTAADNVNFGDVHDAAVAPSSNAHRISNVVIGGTVAGSELAGDHFGFIAVGIGKFKYAGFTAPAYTVPIELSLPTADVTIRQAL